MQTKEKMAKQNFWKRTLIAAAAGLMVGCAVQADPVTELSYGYDPAIKTPVPLPQAERHLQAATAELWFSVPGGGQTLEAATLDKDGNLLFVDTTAKRILKLTPEKKLTEIAKTDYTPAGLALAKNGRIFVAAMDMAKQCGMILSLNPDGTDVKTELPVSAGYMPDDLVFDKNENLYFADFQGYSSVGSGGVYYFDRAKNKITTILPNMAKANGIALTPDGKTLWVTEYARNKLHRVELQDATHIMPVGSTTAFYFTGPAPDSMRIDADGNLYVAMHRQGRFLVLNPVGIPIGQILIPGRDKGEYMRFTSLVIAPNGKDCWLLVGEGTEGSKSAVFHTKALAHGFNLNR